MLSYRVEWYCTSRRVLAAIPFLSLVLAPAAATAQRVAIDKAHSTVTVHVLQVGAVFQIEPTTTSFRRRLHRAVSTPRQGSWSLALTWPT